MKFRLDVEVNPCLGEFDDIVPMLYTVRYGIHAVAMVELSDAWFKMRRLRFDGIGRLNWVEE